MKWFGIYKDKIHHINIKGKNSALSLVCARPQTQRERRAFTSKALKALVQSPVSGSKGGLRTWVGWGRRKPIPAAAKQGTRRDKGTSLLLLHVMASVLTNILADKSKINFPWIHAGWTHLWTTGKVESMGSSWILLENSRRILYVKHSQNIQQ